MFSLRLPFCLLVTLVSLHCISADYIGAESCKNCHQSQWQSWTGSHHQLAMAEATETSVLANFNNTEFSSGGVTSKFEKHEGKFFVTTDNAEGEMEKFQITHTFGWTPLQQYLVSFDDGRKQALQIAWDTRPASEGGQRWFHLYGEENIEAGDLLHWTSYTHNWNTSCAACHSTNLVKNYSPDLNRFDTTSTDINVACEACHGPGSEHLGWAAQPDPSTPNKGFAWSLERSGSWTFTDIDNPIASRVGTDDMSPPFEQQVCAQCHSLRSELKPFQGSFDDAFQMSPVVEPQYHVDGQIQEEDFEWGSFLQSRMHDMGVTCSNCHDPHSAKLRAEPNQLCAQCHMPATFDTPEHHFHPVGSAGTLCVDCHMPATNYMVVDPRRDHSIRIPRPDLSEKLDSPNACSQCHTDRSLEWVTNAFKEWWPDVGRHYSESIVDARNAAPNSLSRLFSMLADPQLNEIARYKILQQVSQSGDSNAYAAIRRYTRSASTVERLGAIDALANFSLEQKQGDLLALLANRFLVVRIAAIRQLASINPAQLSANERQRWNTAIEEAMSVLSEHLDSPGTAMQLSNLYSDMGDADSALQAIEQALVIAPDWPPALINQAALYSNLGDESSAQQSLHRAIAAYPDIGDAYFALALSQIRSSEREMAGANLRRAWELSPNNTHYGYVYGVALYENGQIDQGIDQLLSTYGSAPSQIQVGIAAASYQIAQKRMEAARSTVQMLLKNAPTDARVIQLSDYLGQLP